MEYTGRGHLIPEPDVPIELTHYCEYFWSIRGMIGDADKAMSPAHIAEWSAHTYNNLQKFERDFMFGMDRAFRHERAEVLKFHMERKAVDLGDRDKSRMK